MAQSTLSGSNLSFIKTTIHGKARSIAEHGQRLVGLSLAVGKRLCLSEDSLEELELLCVLHDIGKTGISNTILGKPGKLDDAEWHKMKEHSLLGFQIAAEHEAFEKIAYCILCHHERWDGTGYPLGLSGTEIPLLSRIISVADALDAMTTGRVYRKAISLPSACRELKRCAGTQFDPELVEIVIELLYANSSL